MKRRERVTSSREETALRQPPASHSSVGSRGASSESQSLPVFVFPSELAFYADDSSSHKQILTLYNPYDFALIFHVLCTCPDRYGVSNPSGLLKPRCYVDVVIKRIKFDPSHYGHQDKFRVQVAQHGKTEIYGRKEIPACLLASSPDTSGPISGSGEFRRFRPPEFANLAESHQISALHTPSRHAPSPGANSSTTVLSVITALICIAALSLPLDGEGVDPTVNAMTHHSIVPAYFRLTVPQKLVAAYVLGLVTMILLRT